MAGPSLEDISALLAERKAARGQTVATMREVKDTYKSEVVVPLPEMDQNEKPAIANMVKIGIDQTAMRIASTLPNLSFPPVHEGKPRSMDLATYRTRATLGMWQVNRINLLQRKRARHFTGYGESPVILRPNKAWGCSKYEIQSPLDTYAAPSSDALQFIPDDCIFMYAHNLAWLRKNYPDAESQLLKLKSGTKQSDMFDMVEYVDGDWTVLMAQSRVSSDPGMAYQTVGVPFVEIKRVPNRTGRVPVVIPQRINLDTPMGQFDSQLGMFLAEAKLFSLKMIAVERGIFSDTYLIGRAGETPKIIQGPFDGRTGKITVVSGGVIDVKTPATSQDADQMGDKLERAQRMDGGTPADMTGESASNVRTGKRGDAIMSATIDMNIQEAQEVFAAAAEEEIKISIAQQKAYFGNERKSFFISSSKFVGDVSYVPNQIFENDNCIVTYSYAGSDANSLVVSLSQRQGSGRMSAETAMEIDPMVSDVPREKARIKSEAVEAAVMAAFTQGVTSGEIPPVDAARVAMLVVTEKMEPMEAIIQVHKEAQARQATIAPAGAPEAQAGLGAPGMGAEQPTAPAAPMSAMEALSSLTGKSNSIMKTKTAVG